MTKANTANNATLKIGSETAKPLWYNNERASANNSWEANEIISVFFDGANYRASNSQGGSNKKIDAYLLGDLRLLNIGKNFEKGESVRTLDKQLLRMTKEIKEVSLTEPISVGDFRTYDDTNTYKALQAINIYSNTEYEDGQYAIGSPTKLTLAITKDALEGGDLAITFGENTATVTIQAGDSASDVASAIASALNNVEDIGWTFAASEGVISATCTTLGDNSGTQFSLSTEDSTGVIGTKAVVTEGDEETATVLSLTVTVGAGTINVTLGESTQSITITSSDGAAAIAELIAGLTFTGWTLTFSDNVVTAVNNTGGNNSTSAFAIAENIFNVSGEKTIEYAGSNNVSVYSESTGWSSLTKAQYIAVSSIWGEPLTSADLIEATKNNSIVQDIGEVKDVMFNYNYNVIGEFAGGNTTVGYDNVYFFRQATLKDCLLQKIEFTTKYTGTIYIGFMNPANDKFVGKLRSYVLSNENSIDLNIKIGSTALMLGIGASKAFLKYSYTSGGGSNSVRYADKSKCKDGATLASTNRILSNYNWRITTRTVGESIPEQIDEINTRLTGNVEEINETLKPVKKIQYGVKGVGSTVFSYGSAWFLEKYTVAPGQIIESVDLPSNYTGTFHLYFANSGTRVITKAMHFPLNVQNHIDINEVVDDAAILGFAAFDRQFLYAGSNPSRTYYVAEKNCKVGGGLIVYSNSRGDVNININIKEILPTLEERVDTLESASTTISKPYGDINIIPVHGQSLSLGIERSIPAIPAHKSPIFGGLMFNTGIYQAEEDSGGTLDKMQGVKVLAEGASTIYRRPDYETSCWGTAEMIKKRIIDKVGDNIQTFYLTCGQNGSSINEQFDSELQILERAMLRVKELFPYKTVRIPCFCYVQGEADQASGMDGEVYKTKLRAGREAIQEIAERVLGQTTPVKCILYQTIRGYYTAKKITKAHMELCRDDEMFAPSTSVYTLLDPPNNDRLHISNWGQYLLGQYQGIQFVDWIYYGHKNVGVMPQTISVSGNKITIKFNVSYPPLRFVTDWITNPGNYGFRVLSNGANIIASDGVTITDCDTVEITCSQNIATGDTLYYGISTSTSSGAAGEGGSHIRACRGNLCDSQGELYTTQVVDDNPNSPGLKTVALNNYCYAFYETLNVD